jgi:hypothetical protein
MQCWPKIFSLPNLSAKIHRDRASFPIKNLSISLSLCPNRPLCFRKNTIIFQDVDIPSLGMG